MIEKFKHQTPKQTRKSVIPLRACRGSVVVILLLLLLLIHSRRRSWRTTRVAECQHGQEEAEQTAFHEFIQKTEETFEGVWRGASIS